MSHPAYDCHFSGQNPSALLLSRLTSAPQTKTFLLFEDGDILYRDLKLATFGLVAHFQGMGMNVGERAVVALQGDQETVTTLLALALLGVVTTPFDPGAEEYEQREMLAVIQPHYVIFCEQQALYWSATQLEGVKLLQENQLKLHLQVADNSHVDIEQTVDMQSTMMILYTSGTTAKPKGVELSYQAVLEQSQDMARHLKIEQKSRILNLFRYYQIGSLVNGIYLALLSGASLYRPFQQFSFSDSIRLFETIHANRISHFVLVPTLLAQLLKFPDQVKQAFSHSEFKALLSTAAHLPPVLWQTFESLVKKPIVNTYGLTEANDLTASELSLVDGRIGTVGKPLNCSIKILSDSKGILEAEQQGRLLVQGKTQMYGYFNASKMTDDVVIDGWFDTGDLAKIDFAGNLVYLGRDSERIISGGHTIHPTEVQQQLLQHPDVMDAYVFGEPHDDWQELVAACVVKRHEKLTKAELMVFLRQLLAVYKIPRKLYFIDCIPVSDRGKVRRQDVLSMLNIQS